MKPDRGRAAQWSSHVPASTHVISMKGSVTMRAAPAAVLLARSVTCLTFALSCAHVQAAEGTFPDKPVRLVVPFPPGGVNDIVSRLIANQLHTAWQRPVIIDNRGGAGGNIGAEIAAKSNPDGYTLFIVSSSITSNVALYPKLPFDLRRDFAPISTLVTGAYVLVVNPSVPAATIKELVQLAKAQPRKLTFSSFGEGSSAHLVAELFKSIAGIDLLHVPYKGGAPAMAAVMSGEVQMTFSNLSVGLPQVKAGKLRALAVSSLKRKDALPAVPSLDEAGLKGFDATAWVGLLAPVKVPGNIIARLNSDVRSVLADPELRRQIESRGLDVWPGTPQELARHMSGEIERWGKVIADAGVKLQ
jgi:tripartite-type tricarboxylate transporter receptor subunit TctC